MRKGSHHRQPFTGVSLFPVRLCRHLQRLGLGPVQAAHLIGCTSATVRGAVLGHGVATDQLVLLYAWVQAEDLLHPHAPASDSSSD